MNQQLSPPTDRSTPIDSGNVTLDALFRTLKRNESFARLQDTAKAANISRPLVRLWAERAGLVIWHNRRAGTLIGTHIAKRDDDKLMKAIYG